MFSPSSVILEECCCTRGVAQLKDAKDITLIWVQSVASHLAFVCHLETSWSDSAFQTYGILRRLCPSQLLLCCTECARIFNVSIITSVFSWSAARQTRFMKLSRQTFFMIIKLLPQR